MPKGACLGDENFVYNKGGHFPGRMRHTVTFFLSPLSLQPPVASSAIPQMKKCHAMKQNEIWHLLLTLSFMRLTYVVSMPKMVPYK
jgi:hypothetical protein